MAILIAVRIILAYTLIGGIWSVTLTGALQVGVVLVTLVVLAGATFASWEADGTPSVSGVLAESEPAARMLLPEAGGVAAIAWLGTWASGPFGNIPGQDRMQRVFP